jgi:hypothetical protein
MITRDASAYGLCHIVLKETHPPKGFSMVISLGEWWIDDTAFRRCFSVGFDGTPDKGLVIVEPEAERWQEADHLGRLLTRAQAQADPEVDVLEQILAQLCDEDPILAPQIKKLSQG